MIITISLLLTTMMMMWYRIFEAQYSFLLLFL